MCSGRHPEVPLMVVERNLCASQITHRTPCIMYLCMSLVYMEAMNSFVWNIHPRELQLPQLCASIVLCWTFDVDCTSQSI